jgi:hypothetical protein
MFLTNILSPHPLRRYIFDEARDQPQPGSFPKKDPGYEVVSNRDSKTCKNARKLANGLENLKNRRIWKKSRMCLDDSGPLLYMESVLSESCEGLEILMANLSLDDDDGEC